MKSKRILIVGFGRSGKDTAAEMLAKITGIPYAGSTSWAAKELVAKKLGIHPQIAWETRHQRREEWKAICDEIREGYQTYLIRLALRTVTGEDQRMENCRGIVVGVRDKKELERAKHEKIFDHILWIDRPGTPRDPTVTFEDFDCTSYVMNDGTLDQLQSKLFIWAERHGLIPSLFLSPIPRGEFPALTDDIYRE